MGKIAKSWIVNDCVQGSPQSLTLVDNIVEEGPALPNKWRVFIGYRPQLMSGLRIRSLIDFLPVQQVPFTFKDENN